MSTKIENCRTISSKNSLCRTMSSKKNILPDNVQQKFSLLDNVHAPRYSPVSHYWVFMLIVVLFTVPAGEPRCADAGTLCSHVPGRLPPGRRHDPADLCTLAHERTQKETAKVMKSVPYILPCINKNFEILMYFCIIGSECRRIRYLVASMELCM